VEVGGRKEVFSNGSSPYPWMEKGLTKKNPDYYDKTKTKMGGEICFC